MQFTLHWLHEVTDALLGHSHVKALSHMGGTGEEVIDTTASGLIRYVGKYATMVRF